MSTTQTLKELTTGQWEYIFSVLAPELGEAMEAPLRKHVGCPVHGGNDGFRLYPDWRKTGGSVCNTCGPNSTGIRTLCFIRGWGYTEAARAIYEVLDTGNSSEKIIPREAAPERDMEAEYRAANEKNKKLLRSLQPAMGTVVETYLRNRGITLTPQVELFYAPSLEYWHDKQYYGRFPGMVAKIVNPKGEVVSLHRTYLTPEGTKAPLPEIKKITSPSAPLAGCLIRLIPLKPDAPSRTLGVSEGIETGLAAWQATGLPVWPTVNSTLLMQASEGIPEGWTPLVWADLDKPQPKLQGLGAGQHYARAFVRKFVDLRKPERRPRILLPKGPIPEDSKGVDWLDVWNRNPAAMKQWLLTLGL